MNCSLLFFHSRFNISKKTHIDLERIEEEYNKKKKEEPPAPKTPEKLEDKKSNENQGTDPLEQSPIVPLKPNLPDMPLPTNIDSGSKPNEISSGPFESSSNPMETTSKMISSESKPQYSGLHENDTSVQAPVPVTEPQKECLFKDIKEKIAKSLEHAVIEDKEIVSPQDNIRKFLNHNFLSVVFAVWLLFLVFNL